MLVGTSWSMLAGGARLDAASDELAAVTFSIAGVLLLVGTLHHRGLSAGGGSVSAVVPPAPDPGEATKRYAESDELPTGLSQIGPDDFDDATRYFLAEHLLETFVLNPAGAAQGARGQVWLFDHGNEVLYGLLEPGHPGEVTFAPGEGAVGRSWMECGYVIATGPDVTSTSFGLDATKAARYSDLAAAAAVPITNASGSMIGVLSMSTRDPSVDLGSEEALQQLVFLTEVAARVLVDLFEWFDDGTVSSKKEGTR